MQSTSSTSSNGTVALEERLNNPDTARALNRLLDRLDTIEATVDQLDAMMTQGPALAAMMTDMADDVYQNAESTGVDLDERLHLALQLAERLTAPRTVEVLTKLTNRMDELEQFIALTDQAPGFVSMMTDILDDAYRSAEAAGHDPERLARRSAAGFTSLVESGVLDPEAIEVVGTAGDALAACRAECGSKPPEVGVFGLLRALRDPDTRRALGFLTTFGKHFGQKLND